MKKNDNIDKLRYSQTFYRQIFLFALAKLKTELFTCELFLISRLNRRVQWGTPQVEATAKH